MAHIRIGVISVQGDVSEHLGAMRTAMNAHGYEGEVLSIRSVDVLRTVDGVVLPGGESTAIYKLLRDFGLFDVLRERAANHNTPIFGTCAGMVLLASEGDEQVERSGTGLLGLVSAKVSRNAFGRQRESFEGMVDVKGLTKQYPAVFIRAPAYEKVWGEAEILAEIGGMIVLARQRNVLASAFHPELTGDHRIHGMFLEMIGRP